MHSPIIKVKNMLTVFDSTKHVSIFIRFTNCECLNRWKWKEILIKRLINRLYNYDMFRM